MISNTLKKRTKFIITVLLTICGLVTITYLISTHEQFGLFTRYNYFTAKWDIFNKKPKILHYGKAKYSDSQAIKIAQKFGFDYKVILGSRTQESKPLENGIDIYNSVTKEYLAEKLGKEWQVKFYFQIDSLFCEERVDTIRKIVSEYESVKLLSNYIDSISKGQEHLFISVLAQEKIGPNVSLYVKMKDGNIRIYRHLTISPYSLEQQFVHY